MAARAAARNDSADAQDSRERILAAALDAFSERGFDGATTREIAQRAGVNLGLIQYYFDGKENLWRASVERAFADLRAGFDAIAAETEAQPDRERFRRLIRNFVEFIARRPEFVRLMHDEGKRDGPRMRWLVDHQVRGMYQTVRMLLERSGALPADASEEEAVSLHYVVIGSLALLFHQAGECKYLTGLDPSDPALVDAHVRTLERVLFSPLQENPS